MAHQATTPLWECTNGVIRIPPASLHQGACSLGRFLPSSCLTARWGWGWGLVGPPQPHLQSTGTVDQQGPSGLHPLADQMPPQKQTAACLSQTVTCITPARTSWVQVTDLYNGVYPLTDARSASTADIHNTHFRQAMLQVACLAAMYVMSCSLTSQWFAKRQALLHSMLKNPPAYILVQEEGEVVIQQLQAHFQVLALS